MCMWEVPCIKSVKLTSCSLVYPITKVSRTKSHVYVGSSMRKVSCASCVQSHVESPVFDVRKIMRRVRSRVHACISVFSCSLLSTIFGGQYWKAVSVIWLLQLLYGRWKSACGPPLCLTKLVMCLRSQGTPF